MSLLPLFDRSLLGRATQPALDYEPPGGDRRSATYGELEVRSNQIAHLLRARGLRVGDRVALFLPNRIEFITLWLAAAKLGLIVVPVNVLFRARELTHLLHDAEPAAVVTTHELAAFVPGELAAWDVDVLVAEATTHPATRIAETLGASQPMALMYTSGTAGAPKGAVLTHGNFAANALTLVDAWEITAADRYLAALPLFHAHGLANGLHCWLVSGCHMRLCPRFDHTRAAQWFEEYQPTLFLGVPTMFIRLLDVPGERARRIGSRLRLAVSGAAPLPADVHDRFRALYGCGILERYGMTETLGNAANPYRGERRVGSVGPALPHVEIRIVDEAGHDVPDGTAGEIWVRGPNVCAGYWRQPQATAAVWRDGWFRTGDVGVRAPDGYITLEGRRSDLIISGGFKIQPAEIEALMREQPGVRDAAVAAMPDPVRGEVPVAYVVVDEASFDEPATAACLREQLASFKQPRAFVRVDAIPRTALGKVQRYLLPAPSQRPHLP
jgi:malonyl-CoA/methylmalonyl-CoA synthetase